MFKYMKYISYMVIVLCFTAPIAVVSFAVYVMFRLIRGLM